MTTVDLNLPPVPNELKIVAPYVSRAQELKGKDPVIAYYCLYHAVQTGIGVKTHQKDSKAYLMSLMTKLETMKDQLKDRKEINSDEAAAPYIENFALKVFTNADNEDRRGGGNRSTAKKFLAASNFLELLVLFDEKYLNKDIQAHEKIKYAKWKAADIAKAFREGRVPIAGPPASTIETSEDEYGDKHSDFEDVSMGSSAAKQAKSSSSTEIHEYPSSEPATAKPALPTMDSSSSMETIVHNKTAVQSSAPKHISTAAAASIPPPQYVIDVSSPSPVSSGSSKTPLKSPIPGDGMWSTAATPGLDSPNFGGSWGRAALNSLSPAALAMFNSSIAKGDSPISPGMSPKPKSGLGANVVTASDLAKAPKTTKGLDVEEGVETDSEDGQWSTAGNDPFSRQNSMIPPPSGRSFNLAHNTPGLVVTPSLGAVHEEASPAKSSAQNTAHPGQNVTTSAALSIPLPPSASNSAPSSPGIRPNSVAFAASHPLPPLLPPPSKTPTSIKSESHILPSTEPEEKVYKYTSNIVGDSTSDSEASYNVRKRANTVVPSQPGKAEMDENTSSHHVRSSSVNTAAVPQPPTPTPLQPPMSAPATKTSMDDDWERASISRLARLPESVSGSDMDSLSGRLRGLDLPNTSSSDTTPTPIAPNHAHTGQDDFKSRRNTIRAGGPSDPHSGSDFGINLPGVPSAPPVGDWGRRGSGKSDSDSGGEGDVLARLPSAPAAPPTLQDQLPHVAIFHKPASPRDELQTNPHFPSYPPPIVPGAPNGAYDDSLTPRSQTHSRAPSSTSSGAPVVPSTISPPPPPAGYPQPPLLSTTASSDAGSSMHLGYTPPNSVVSPHANFAGNLVPGVPYHHYAQHPYPHPHGVQSPGNHPFVPPVTAPQGFYQVGPQTNGVNGSHDEFGLGIPARPPPTSLEPEIVAKAQKHAKFAQSALNFDDLETAREELKKALRLLS